MKNKIIDFISSLKVQVSFVGFCASIVFISAINDLVLGNTRVGLAYLLIVLWMIMHIVNLKTIDFYKKINKSYSDMLDKSIALLNEIHDKVKEVDISPSDEAMKSTPTPEGVKANEPY